MLFWRISGSRQLSTPIHELLWYIFDVTGYAEEAWRPCRRESSGHRT